MKFTMSLTLGVWLGLLSSVAKADQRNNERPITFEGWCNALKNGAQPAINFSMVKGIMKSLDPKGTLTCAQISSQVDMVKKLDLTSMEISALVPGLDFLAEITELRLSHNLITVGAMVQIEYLPKLQRLWLDHNLLEGSQFILPKAPNLSFLDVSYNGLTSLENTFSNHEIHVLYAHHNRLTTTKGLREAVINHVDQHPSMAVLDLSYNQLGEKNDLTHIRFLSSLGSLNLSNNGLTSLSKMVGKNLYDRHLKDNLFILDVSENKLTNLSDLAEFRMASLILDGNPMNSIDDGLAGATIVSLARTSLTDSSPLQRLDDLEILSLVGSNVSDLGFIDQHLPNLNLVDASNLDIGSFPNRHDIIFYLDENQTALCGSDQKCFSSTASSMSKMFVWSNHCGNFHRLESLLEESDPFWGSEEAAEYLTSMEECSG